MKQEMKQEEILRKKEEEKAVVGKMINIYCRANHYCKSNHGGKKGLCDECEELLNYAMMRIDKCPFTETKTFCASCKVHCYKPEMQEKIRQVMRFSGPRMIFYHPIMTLKHGLDTLKQRRALKSLEKRGNEQ